MSEANLASASSTAIIGAGIIGLSIAWRLAERGLKVTLFDQSAIASESSWAGAGMLAPGGETTERSEFADLLIASRKRYRDYVSELEDQSGLAIDFQESGALDLAYSQAEWEELQVRAERQRPMGILCKPIPLASVRAFWPRVRMDGLAGALFYPGDAIVNSRDVLAALTQACRNQRVAVNEYRQVHSLTISSEAVAIETTNGAQSFARVIVAAGAWSSSLQVSGVPPLPSVEPVKGHLVGYQQPFQTCTTILRHGHTYMLQRANGMLITGASVERVGFDREISPAIASRLARDASFILPHLQETTPTEVWTGFRPGAQQLQLGPWQSPRLLLAYGHFRNGILLAPITAERIAAAIFRN